jgi:dUTP pyrophosphatase
MSRIGVYILKVFVDSDDAELKRLYNEKATEINKYYWNKSIKELDKYYDAGFDLYCPEGGSVSYGDSIKINHKVKCSMKFVLDESADWGKKTLVNLNNVSYYTYPRSSTGSKTPLRLANSVGIIDAGYRGHLISVFDHVKPKEGEFVIEKYQRLMQICSHNMTYPLIVELVETEEELSGPTIRGSGGFGSKGA